MGIVNQLDALAEQQAQVAMSVISNNQRALNVSGMPNCMQTNPTNGNTSAVGSNAHTEAQCKRLLSEQQIHHGEQMDALTLQNQELLAKIQSPELNAGTAATAANTSHSGFHNQDQKSRKKDVQGRKWYQVKFQCSKHGFNTSHSNENCNSKHLNKGHPWIPGATLANTKGGNNAHADKFNHWYEPRARQYSPQPPN